MAGYSIIEQRQRMVTSPTGGLVQGMVVTFRTDHGTVSSVEIPMALYTPDNVAAEIGKVVDTIDAVHKLGG